MTNKLGTPILKFYEENILAYMQSLIQSPIELLTLIIDLGLVIFLVVKFFQVLKGSRALQLIKGIFLLIVVTILSSLLNLSNNILSCAACWSIKISLFSNSTSM